jgi:GrpB-like predicted nucleotidyltransferase (UPF0157 family)
VAVSPDRFEAAKETLAKRYAAYYPEDWEPTRASFAEVPELGLPVGVQLVVAGTEDERVFLAWRDRLREDAKLLKDYNEFKAGRAGDDYEAYTEAKAGFIEARLGEI